MPFRYRSLSEDIKKHLPKKQYTIITGARQVGKTSLLRHWYRQLRKAGEHVFFLSFEDGDVLKEVNTHPEKIFTFIDVQPLSILEGITKKRIYLLVDEIQYADDPTNFLKLIYDKYEINVKIIATGSSAFYMDDKFTDSLAGRKRIFTLFPLTFREYLMFQDKEELVSELESASKPVSLPLKRIFHEYLIYGGYPEVALEPDKEEKQYLLSELKNAYIKRDMQESGIKKTSKFLLLIKLLAEQAGNLVNRNELGGTLSVDSKTIDHYIYVLQKCYHIYLIKPFYRNLRKELTKMPKVYFNDLGLRNSFLNRFTEINIRSDKGALLENYFFCQARHKSDLDQIFFWRTTNMQEVDFILEEEFGKGKAWEIKWNPRQFKIGKYKKFTEAYPDFELDCFSEESFYQI